MVNEVLVKEGEGLCVPEVREGKGTLTHTHKKKKGLPRAAWHPNCSGERNKESVYISLRPCPRRKIRPKGQRQVGDCETGLASSHSYFLEACKLHWAIYSPHVRAFFSDFSDMSYYMNSTLSNNQDHPRNQ